MISAMLQRYYGNFFDALFIMRATFHV